MILAIRRSMIDLALVESIRNLKSPISSSTMTTYFRTQSRKNAANEYREKMIYVASSATGAERICPPKLFGLSKRKLVVVQERRYSISCL
jgi:hypothetical protein